MIVFKLVSLILILQAANCNNNGLKVITKLPRSPLMKYTSYSNVMILHFVVPVDTTEAVFKFRARDDSTSMFATHCTPRNVSVYMKSGSYPVINPDGVPFPKTFLNISRPVLHEITLLTNLTSNYVNISSPTPGDWFAVAFLSWTDPKKDRIEQQGLTSECEASIFAELLASHESNMKILADNVLTDINLYQNKPQFFKFFVPDDIDHVIVSVEIIYACKTCDNVSVLIQPGEIPNEKNYQEKLVIDVANENMKIIRLWPQENMWHYFNITLFDRKDKGRNLKDFVELNLSLKYISGLGSEDTYNLSDANSNIFKSSVNKQLTIKHNALQNILRYKQYNLMRLTASDNFIFEYDFRPSANGSVPVLLNVTNDEMAVLKFAVYDIIDIGGTMTIGLAIKPELKTKKENTKNFSIIACVRKDVREVPLYPNQCLYNNGVSNATIVLNSTNSGTLEFVHVPFPDPGTYYLTLRAFFDECTPCNCTETCEVWYESCLVDCEYNCTDNCSSCMDFCKNQIMSLDECYNCNCDGACDISNNTKTQNASLVFSISSHPCIAGRCGKHGRCNHYMAGGFIFSSCQCLGGYRGWDCSDDSEALSDGDILIAILLLTLSNLLFIPSIYFAYKRDYYTEAATYFSSMFASTFYHACDSKENQYGFCLFPLGVLQFCDFYCALLAIWVTLVAMAYTNRRVISISHIMGAILLAFGVTYNKHALWVYLMPTILGFAIIGVNWGLKCRNTRKLFPARRYLKIYMPLGSFLVLMGLISFAFLETKENYKIVHSLWHVVMALSLIFLLPNKKTFLPK